MDTWACGPVNNPTPKDEISNAYSALFLNPANNYVILYAGGERDKNNGNSFMGFWIFKGRVGCSSPGMFSGQHSEGDILVLSNFTGGGVHPLVEIYKWTAGALSLVDSGNFCHAALAGDDTCGEVNGAVFQTAWAPHNAAANPLDLNEFLEVGVDLTAAANFAAGTIPCFANFQAETRSSQETNATLKDYAAGHFNTCTSSTVTTPMSGEARSPARRSSRGRRSRIAPSSRVRHSSARRPRRPGAFRSSCAARSRPRHRRSAPAAVVLSARP